MSKYVLIPDFIVGIRWFREIKKIQKAILSSTTVMKYAAEQHAALAANRKYSSKYKARYSNIKEAREALKEYIEDGTIDENSVRLTCLPDSEAERQAYLWLLSFIELVGDCSPTRFQKIQIPGIYTKESIHAIYKHNIEVCFTADEFDILELSSFKTLWGSIFPNVTITRYCHVSGKCETCHALYERQEVFKNKEELEQIRRLSAIHKIMIESNRLAYIQNRQLAQENKDLYMSVIIDGMSNNHSVLPFLANVDTPSSTMSQKITGAKQHGIARTFYRTFPHISTGANLACEVLLREIERRMDYSIENDVPFPRWLLAQVDGGSENTSRTFYALCEYLVRIGIFDRIEVARLPVGHTHDDIDALFGVLWRALRGKTIITPQQWREMAISAFC